MPKKSESYQLNQISQYIDLLHIVLDASEKIKVKPYELFFSRSWAGKKLGLNRYYTDKLFDSLLVNGLIVRNGNRYRVSVENQLMFVMGSIASVY